MVKNVKKEAKGFTIIEVMIVLLIGGLIMLIVFLAIPALQRNSRNTQRRNDAASILAAVNEWSQTNNGRMPSTAAEQTAALQNAKLGIFDGQVTYGASPWPGVDAARVVVNNKCNGETAVTAQNRAVAVIYNVETGGGTPAQQCEDS